ncbi:phosphatidate cytidylyltransferase [Desulfotomaculum varum]
MDKLLHLRVLSALVGIPIALLAAWYGSWLLWLITMLIFITASLEMTAILKGLGLQPAGWIIQIGGLILFAEAYQYKDTLINVVYVFLVLANLLWLVFCYPKQTPTDVFGNLVATLYLGNLVFLYLTRELPGGLAWLLLILTTTWASDTFAYFVGRAMGRHKLAPLLSPKKTIEGAVGGIAGAALTAYLLAQFMPGLPVQPVVLLGALVGAASLLGDLFESALKRQAGVKDSGHLIPGHGGILDRFDSLLITTPLVYYIIKLFII